MKLFLPCAALAAALFLLPATPAAAADDWAVKDIYGSDPCPTSNGEEIVVCRRLPETERYRIPKDLRDAAKDQPGPTWSNRALDLEYVGRSGTNSCSADGGGGMTGCWSKLMREAREERKAKREEERKIEYSLP